MFNRDIWQLNIWLTLTNRDQCFCNTLRPDVAYFDDMLSSNMIWYVAGWKEAVLPRSSFIKLNLEVHHILPPAAAASLWSFKDLQLSLILVYCVANLCHPPRWSVESWWQVLRASPPSGPPPLVSPASERRPKRSGLLRKPARPWPSSASGPFHSIPRSFSHLIRLYGLHMYIPGTVHEREGLREGWAGTAWPHSPWWDLD